MILCAGFRHSLDRALRRSGSVVAEAWSRGRRSLAGRSECGSVEVFRRTGGDDADVRDGDVLLDRRPGSAGGVRRETGHGGLRDHGHEHLRPRSAWDAEPGSPVTAALDRLDSRLPFARNSTQPFHCRHVN